MVVVKNQLAEESGSLDRISFQTVADGVVITLLSADSEIEDVLKMSPDEARTLGQYLLS
ncbi:hypothetical protein [Fibrisoma montanum]|uniref:hypothetical protein n=1 Tax=Fibrisoma montanum TaxID=2305895 RepID=UPI0013146AD0|nr:hypothetical protein [Fibrisoma montanum]